jgi:hypothetical protein
LLSVALVFHLTCVLWIPNLESVVGNELRGWILPYLNLFELTDTWSFFAPNPGLPAFVEWETEGAQGQVLAHERWPEVPSPYSWSERRLRRVAAADFMIKSESSVERILLPYLCRRDPRVEAVRLWRVAQSLPSADEVAGGRRKIGDEVGQDRRYVSHTFCQGYR